MLIGCV